MARIIRKQLHRKTVAIVGDGQMERIYFSDVRDTDRPDNLSIFPDYPKKIGHYNGVLDRAISLVEDYTHVYALIDLDKIIQDNQNAAYERDKKIAQAAGVMVLENNPCFEIWLLVHFVYTGKLFTNCGEVTKLLRGDKRIPGYEKSEKYLRNARLYKTFKDQLVKQAIPNAKRLEESRSEQDQLYPRAETYRFFEWYLNITDSGV